MSSNFFVGLFMKRTDIQNYPDNNLVVAFPKYPNMNVLLDALEINPDSVGDAILGATVKLIRKRTATIGNKEYSLRDIKMYDKL